MIVKNQNVIILKQDNLEKQINALKNTKIFTTNHQIDESTFQSMKEYFPIDDDAKKMETVDIKLKTNRTFFNQVVSSLIQ